MSSPNKQSGGTYGKDKNQYGVARSSQDGNSTEERASIVTNTNKQPSRDSTQSVNSISMECDPMFATTPSPLYEKDDGRYLRLHEMIQHQDDSFYPVSDTDSEASHLDDNAPDSEGHQDFKFGSGSQDTSQNLKTLQSSPLHGRSLGSRNPKEQQAPFRMGLVSQEDLDELEREEEEKELRGEMIGKQSVQLGAALGLKSSIKEYVSPSNILKKKLKNQGVTKIENGSSCRKISPLVLASQNADGGTTSAFITVSTGSRDVEEIYQGEKPAASDLSLSLTSSDDLRRRIHQHESVPKDGSSSSSPRSFQSLNIKSLGDEKNENSSSSGTGPNSTKSDINAKEVESDDHFSLTSSSDLLPRFSDQATNQHSSVNQDLLSDENPTLMQQSKSFPLHGRSLGLRNPKEQQAPFRMGLVSQEDLDELEREEEEKELRGEMIGKQSVQLGAALGLKSSIKEYVSPSNILKKKLKNQGVTKIENSSSSRKISPLVLASQNADGGTTSAFITVSTGSRDVEEIYQGEKPAASDLSLSLTSSDDLRRRIHQHESVPKDGSSSSSPRSFQSLNIKSLGDEENENSSSSGTGPNSTKSDINAKENESDSQFSFTSPSDLLLRHSHQATSQHSSVNQDLLSDEFSYTTPSQLLNMGESDSKEALGRNLTDDNPSYTTPLELLRLESESNKQSKDHQDSKDGGQSCSPDTSQNLRTLHDHQNPTLMQQSKSSPLHGRGLGSRNPKEQQAPFRMGLVSQEDLDELEREEEEKELRGEMIGKQSVQLGAALGLKSSIKEYVSPSNILKKKLKNQGVTKIENGSSSRKISPLVLASQNDDGGTTSAFIKVSTSKLEDTYQHESVLYDGSSSSSPRSLQSLKIKSSENLKEDKNSSSSGNGSNTTQSNTNAKKVESDSQFVFTSSSDLLLSYNDQATNQHSSVNQDLLSDEFSYTTPQLLNMDESDSKETLGRNLTDDNPSYTTQSELLRLERSQVLYEGQSRDESFSDSVFDSVFDSTDKANILQSVVDREQKLAGRDVYGKLSYTTPSKLLEYNRRRCDQDEKLKQDPCSKTCSSKPRTTPSILVEEYVNKSTKEPPTDVGKLGISQSLQGYAFLKRSSLSVLEGSHGSSSVDTGLVRSRSAHVSGYGSDASASVSETVPRKPLNWSTISDITTYFSSLSNIFHNAAILSGSISEPWFMRLFLSTTAISMYEMSEVDQTSYEELTSGQTSTGISRQDFMEQMYQLIDNDAHSDATVSPRESTTSGYQSSQMSICSLVPENKLSFFNKFFWSLFEIDPKLAILILGSQHDLIRLLESKTMVSSNTRSSHLRDVDSTTSSNFSMHGLFDSLDNLKKSESDLSKKKTTSMSSLSSSEIRTMQLEKESLEGQVRRLGIENSTLHGENRILRQRLETDNARIADLEEKLNISQDALGVIERSMNVEISEVCHRNRVELEEHIQVLDCKVTDLQKENEQLKCENVSFERQISNMKKEARQLRTGDKNKTLEAYMRESELLTQEVEKLRRLLHESEEQVEDLSKRLSDGTDHLLQVCKVRDMLQQQLDTGGSSSQLQALALEKRLEVTEERLKLEREDRGNSLSVTEEKLLSENARLQAMEKEYTRQLQREKDKTRNLEIKIRDIKSRNEKLLLSLPIDDSVIESSKLDFDIPYSIHSSKRLETKKVYDINQILTLLEKEKGLSFGQENEIIKYLWNQRESLVNRKRQWEITLEDLNLPDNDIAGLKSLKEMKDDFESKIETMEEKLEDMESEKDSLDKLYKEQLGSLIKERHTAFGKLKTLTDMMEAIRAENESLRESLKSSNTTNTQSTVDESEVKRLNIEIRQLEDKLTELNRTNKQQSIELQSVHAQLDSRNKALEDAQAELSLLTSRLSLDDTSVRKQQKIDRLTTQVSNQQVDMKKLSEKCGILGAENSRLAQQVENITRELHNTQQQRDIKGNEILETRIRFLESEKEQRNIQAEKANLHYKETESKLQEIKQELYFYQEHSSDLKSQVESYSHQLNQKITLLDTIGRSEKEKLNQIEVLKDTLNTMTTRLNNKQSQLQICELEMSQVKDLNDKLEIQLEQYTSKHSLPTRTQSATELQISQLQAQIEKFKSDIVQAVSALKTSHDENEEIRKELSTTRQQLNDEKSKIVHLESEKNNLEQQMETIGEERDVLFEEKTINEDDLVKLESKLQQVLHRFEDKTIHEHSQLKYKQDGTYDFDELISEINSLKLLLDGKDRELEIYNDKQKRNQIEMSYLHHRVENLNKENKNCREEIDRLTNDVIFKMKENSATYEVNDYLTKEKAYQQKEIIHLQKDYQTEKDYVEKMKAEINAVLLKVDQSEMGQQAIQSELIVKDGEIASYKTEIKHLEISNKQLETELKHHKSRIEELNTEIHTLTKMKSSLENQLTQEKHSVEKEKSLNDRKKEEVHEAKQRVDAIKHEQTFLLNALQEERVDKQQLTQQLSEKESKIKDLSQEVASLKKELSYLESNLSQNHIKLEELHKDQSKVDQEQSELNLIIREKDREISELREKEMIVDETIRKEVSVKKSHFEQEKSVIERELQFAKDEVKALSDKVQQKELQLQSFGRTLQELDETNRKKYELESEIEKSERTVSDSKILVESQRKELIILRQENSKLHESFAKCQINCHTLQDELRLIKESTEQQLSEYKTMSAAQKDQNDAEKFSLREAFTRSEAKLQATENSLKTLTESKIQLNNDYRALEASFNDIKSQLTTEITERKLAQQRADNLKANLDEIKNTKSDTDKKLLEVQALVTKTEGEVNQQKEKVKKFNHHNQELEAMVQVNDCTVRAKQEQIDLLQSENYKLKQMMETQKQQVNTKLRKHTLEQKLIVDNIKQEKQNLSQQAMQLSVDLEQAREQIALKNKENLRLQEDILGLEDQKRTMNSELRASRDNLKTEEVMQSKLVSKFSEQEEELKRLRNMWSKQDDDSDGDPKLMWKKMNSVIQGLSEQIQASNDSQLLKDKEAKERENKVIHRYKKQILELQSQLNTEKALHQITKNSLKALEEDCARLRQLMHTVRRKSGSPDKKQKSRIEEINEIIVRSQTQAQSMMASGAGYLDSSFKNISPSRDYNINHNRSGSPDTTSQLSDCSLGSAAGINTSYVHMSGTFQPGTFTKHK